VSLVIGLLHLENVRASDELVVESVVLFVLNLDLNCDQHILEIHRCVVQLHRVLGHVVDLPSKQGSFLRLLVLRFRDTAGDLLVTSFVQFVLDCFESV